ncbi:MAG: alpha/beta hydrolase [SAR202 cluster bacterium]|jgi:arylformamidase|nr:alpha/beta hydrolase [SAR202 cluster bacterium]MDP6513205.1 alpha/beta hydrolase [SAR202 cluster bacterium]MDP6713380.1 alpha/beta hydrolase [SAR202 cluster bacterium]
MAKLLKKQPPMSPPAEVYSATAFQLTEEAKATTRHVLDVAYGPEDDQDIDIYLPDDPSATDVPVFVFIHGGSWTHGYKEWLGFMAPPFTSMPAIFVSVAYRLAPDTKFPLPVEDCRNALKWVYENISDHGGDRDRIFLGGHSAGGHLAAMVTLQLDALEASGMPRDVVKACFPVSGVFDFTERDEDRLNKMLESPSDAEAASPIRLVEGNQTPFLFAIGEIDFPDLIPQCHAMADALRGQSGAVEVMDMPGEDHFKISLQGGNPEGPWVTRVREWIANPPTK